jgi:hypothetical protein
MMLIYQPQLTIDVAPCFVIRANRYTVAILNNVTMDDVTVCLSIHLQTKPFKEEFQDEFEVEKKDLGFKVYIKIIK